MIMTNLPQKIILRDTTLREGLDTPHVEFSMEQRRKIAHLLDKANLLGWLEEMASPVIERFLGLPTETTGAFLLGFLRRDYGAAGLFDLARQGLMNENQVIVSLVTLTLFVPCLANFFMIIKERGVGTAFLMMGLIIPFALLVGGALNFILQQ